MTIPPLSSVAAMASASQADRAADATGLDGDRSTK
jgi:hypothetical protein